MEWSERMNAAIDYIERNLAGEIDIDEAARAACCSPYHFLRVFFAVNGITPAEYARRRRLTLAATELSSSKNKVIDIAMKYGYDSPNAFTRAFRNLHGVTPQAAREPGVTLTAYPRISFHIELLGGNDMDYRIIETPAFEVVGQSERFPGKVYYDYIIDPEAWEAFWWKFWESFLREKRYDSLEKLANGKPGRITGAVYLTTTTIQKGKDGFTYTVGVEKPETAVPADFEVVEIPAATWAVFESVGPLPKSIHDIEDQIFREWFPSTGYEYDAKPELEVYLPGDPKSADYRSQAWIPVVKKK